MKRKFSSERGQALVLIAFGLIGLIAITGLAVDGGMALSDRRHAQNAADSAALAGAFAKIQDQADCALLSDDEAACEKAARAPMRNAALNRAISNGYTCNLINCTVEVYTCDEVDDGADCPSPYAGNSDYIQVIISTNLDTFFARVVGIPQVHNRVQAIALADDDDSGPLFDGRAIIALNPKCPPNGSMVMGGNADVTIIGGGVWANANDACSFACTSSSVVIDIVDGELSSPAASFSKFSDHCKAGLSDDTITYNGDQIPYPPEEPDLPVPAACDGTNSGNYHASKPVSMVHPETGKTVAASYIYPGYYDKFPPARDQVTNKNLESNIFMAPGIYCVQELKQTGGILMGEDVTIYVRPENGIGIEGGITRLKATQTGPFAGYLIVVATNYPSKAASCTVNGNSYNIFQGSIFAPHCDVTINGDSKTPDAGIDAQIIGFNVTVNGGAGLTIRYDGDKNPVVIDPPKTGIAR